MAGPLIPHHRLEWVDDAKSNESAYRAGFADLGIELSNDEVEQYRLTVAAPIQRAKASISHHVHRPASTPQYDIQLAWDTGEATAKRNLLEVLKQYRIEIEDSVTQRMDVPLFYLSSPPVSGSNVEYREIDSEGSTGTWKVTVFGTGMGATQSYTIKRAVSFSSTNGSHKCVFVPVEIALATVTVYRKGRQIGRGIRTEAAPNSRAESLKKGIVDIGDRPPVDPDLGHPGWLFPLRGDKPSSVSTYEEIWTVTDDVAVAPGLRAFGIEIAPSVKIQRERELQLTLELPGGRDYRLRPLKGLHGMSWSIE